MLMRYISLLFLIILASCQRDQDIIPEKNRHQQLRIMGSYLLWFTMPRNGPRLSLKAFQQQQLRCTCFNHRRILRLPGNIRITQNMLLKLLPVVMELPFLIACHPGNIIYLPKIWWTVPIPSIFSLNSGKS